VHATALPGNPYDGHTLGAVIAATERFTGRLHRARLCGQGLSRQNTADPRRVFIFGQKRAVCGSIKRGPRRRSTIEAARPTH
jgi:IS5 family transposase